MLYATASQTVGPYLHIGMSWLDTSDLVIPGTKGTPVTIEGCVVDGRGDPVPDAMLETWQANAAGFYTHPDDQRAIAPEAPFRGFGRMATDIQGCFRMRTVKPGRVPGGDGRIQAPHILVSVFARGLLARLATRIYFPGEPSNDQDPVLELVPHARRATLVAHPIGDDPERLEFNIVLQGEWLGQGETVFFEV